jgi:drug/metabolite transporter (DMT)-like permease
MERKETISNAFAAYACIMVLASGAYAGVSNKFMYDMHVEGLCGDSKMQKPYFFTLFMFVGEAMCLLYFYAEKLYRHFFPENAATAYPTADTRLLDPNTHIDSANGAPQATANGTPTNGTANGTTNGTTANGLAKPAPKRKPPVWFFFVLSLFDLSATTIGGIGLIWVSASANQMLRGSMILFTALWTLLIFRKNLSRSRWIGIAITMAGLVLVGGAGMLDPSSNNSTGATSGQVLIGILLVLAGSALNACQGVLEEKLMKGLGDVEADPMEVVGWEGVFGCCTSSFIMLPIVQAMSGSDCGSVENTKDTLKMMGNSPALVALIMFYAISLAFMNNYSQVVSKHLSAIHRMLLNTCRVVVVWVVDLIIYYRFTTYEGENWDNYSFMQLGGFFLLIAGSLVYVRAAQLEARGQQPADSPSEHAKHLPIPVNDGRSTGATGTGQGAVIVVAVDAGQQANLTGNDTQ